VLVTHQHSAGMSMSQDGKRTIVDNPAMCDPKRMAYKHLNTNTMPEWQLGFSVIKDGLVSQYVEGAAYGLKL
jgi:hypothetical protein